MRGFAGLTGHLKEAQMPFAAALAALSVHNGKAPARIDTEREAPFDGAVASVLAVTVGYARAEGAALVSKA
jgi:3-oxoacyl-[acyl-carrier-protein] synthase II